MLLVEPTTWFSWDFRVTRDDLCMAQVHIESMRSDGSVVVGDEIFEIERENLFSGPWTIQRRGETYATAVKPKVFSPRMEIDVGGTSYVLEAPNSQGRKFVLVHGGEEIGYVRPVKLMSRQAVASLPDELPGHLQAFVIWLVLLMWKRLYEGS